MPTPICSKCNKVIPSEDINVAKDIAYCRTCNLSYPLSELTAGADLETQVDLVHPPAGVWYKQDGSGPVIGATHRSLGAAIGALVFGLFWNGILSIFILVATAATLTHLHIPVPEWFPAPNMNGSPMGVGMTLFLWLFLTPFIVIGLIMIVVFISSLAGRTEVQIRNLEGVIFTGVGGLGWRRRFDRSAVQEVRIEDKQWRDSDGDSRRKAHIVIETRQGKRLKFGSMLTDERRKFVAGAVRRALKG